MSIFIIGISLVECQRNQSYYLIVTYKVSKRNDGSAKKVTKKPFQVN